MSVRKKILWTIFPILIVLVVFAGVLGITASFGVSTTTPSKPAASDPSVAPDLTALLNVGKGPGTDGYFEKTSSGLVAAAAGQYNSSSMVLANCWSRTGSAVPLSTSAAR